jgi:hypothetical protein
MMGELEKKLMKKAIRRHKTIFPCPHRGTFETCFTREPDRILFWYNTKDRSTHLVSARLVRQKEREKRNAA